MWKVRSCAIIHIHCTEGILPENPFFYHDEYPSYRQRLKKVYIIIPKSPSLLEGQKCHIHTKYEHVKVRCQLLQSQRSSCSHDLETTLVWRPGAMDAKA